MAVSSAKSGKLSRVFMESLASAVLEWLLLFLLFLNAIIAYLVTKFARCCGLQTPCLLCSRLDHVLGNEKSGFYWDMICGTHKLEISALAICHAHSSRGHVHEAMKIIGGGYFDHLLTRGIGSLPHVGYTELKATSDTESDVIMFSDDDGTGVLVPGPAGHVSLDFASLETPVIDAKEDREVGNVESGVEIGLKEMNRGSSEIKKDSAFVNELVFINDFHPSRNEVGAPEKPCATEVNESAEIGKVIQKAETELVPTPEKSSEEKKNVLTETSQEVPSISNGRESEDSESPSHNPVTESSPNTLSPRVSFHEEVMNELSGRKLEEVTIPNSSSSNGLDTIQKNETNELSGRELEEVTIPNGLDAIQKNETNELLNSSNELSNSSSSNGLNSLEKNESDLSLEGEVESLKRQIEEDREALHELHRELEEERNAAAIAANEAMAMITRLQDEKANLHMEAQQYLRMMEEQAEYDMDALQKSNDLLVEREMEIQDLEDELEAYRINEPLSDNINDSLLCIEDERVNLQQCLKKLEERLKLRVSSENPNLANSECNGNGVDEQSESDSTNKDSFSGSKGVNVDSLAKEVSSLQERLEKLETDRVFIERAIKYLRIGDEGLLFIQDLASHLQELRK